MEIIIPDASSHWYLPDGKPIHSVPKKSGQGYRNFSLRWDRRLGAYPSVTNIIGVKHKEALVIYKVKHAIRASLTLSRLDDEDEDDFIKRIVIEMDRHRDEAADFGTRVHKAAEHYHQHNRTIDEGVEPYIVSYKQWFNDYVQEVLYVEKVLVNNKIGYAGTCDLIIRRKSDNRVCIVDIKTQGIKSGKKPNIYDTWLLQMRAYGALLLQHNPVYVTPIINSTEPSDVIVHEWPENEYDDAWRAFLACCFLWSHDRNYWPTRYWHEKNTKV